MTVVAASAQALRSPMKKTVEFRIFLSLYAIWVCGVF